MEESFVWHTLAAEPSNKQMCPVHIHHAIDWGQWTNAAFASYD